MSREITLHGKVTKLVHGKAYRDATPRATLDFGPGLVDEVTIPDPVGLKLDEHVTITIKGEDNG